MNVPAHPVSPEFSDLLNAEIKQRELTLDQLSALMACRLSTPAPQKAAISKWSRGLTVPAEHHMQVLAEVFGWGEEQYLTAVRLLAKHRAGKAPRGGRGVKRGAKSATRARKA